ncbi:MAG: toxin HipA [Oceanobacter sp.]|jgi:serine/threonine-protein kinase HipA|nr:MAG: toxin HipA [Oceanobacter sp.]
METLTLQTYLDGHWQDACELSFYEPEKGRHGRVSLEYNASYVAKHQSNLAARVSMRYPIDFFPHECDTWPAFLFDVMPMGAGRRYWLQRENLSDGAQQDLHLLRLGSRSPIGNLRVKESCLGSEVTPLGFSMADILSRDTHFLDYARENGAAVGGASGAGGDAPKFQLIRGQDGLYYPEASLPDSDASEFFLVKFPRQSSSQGSKQGRPLASDILVLETEAAYYRIAKYLGLNVVGHPGYATNQSESAGVNYFAADEEKHITTPSLWLPRFDRLKGVDGMYRCAIESLYSLVGNTEPGASVPHRIYLKQLADDWRDADQGDEIEELVIEYLHRDLLNILLGNSDNHGRNTSIIRWRRGLQLAPIYDLAPMVLDDSGITRTSRWSNENELGGRYDWRGICTEASAATQVNSDALWSGLCDFAKKLAPLKRLAEECDVPHEVLNHHVASLNLSGTEERLKTWGLLP